jgi:hypothetical protein
MLWLLRTSRGFPEVFVLGDPLDAPQKLPERYLLRAKKVAEDDAHNPIFLVDSLAFVLPTQTNQRSITRNGMWIVPADARPSGGIDNAGVADICSVFGIPIVLSESKLQQICSVVPSAAKSPSHVLYHGTSSDVWESLCKHGLRPTYGMLGVGVYLGTFWKAARYASQTQTYSDRKEGIIVRVYVFAFSLFTFPENLRAPAYVCKCENCERALRSGEGAQIERAAHTDHLSQWALDKTCHGAELLPKQSKANPSLWIVRNAEWCIRPECVQIQNCALLEMRQDAVYDPCDRTRRIL